MKKLIYFLLIFLSLCGCVQGENSQSSHLMESKPIQPASTPETHHISTQPAADDSLLSDADIMAEYITRAVDTASSLDNPKFNYKYFVFICNMEKDRPDFCYYNPTPVDKDGNLHIDISDSEKIIWQVFGEKWDISEHIGEYIKSDETTVYHPTEIGWGMMCYYPYNSYVHSEFNGDKTQIHTYFEMWGPDISSGDPSHKSYGNYKLIYDIIGEDNQTFLRFNRFEKI